MKESKDPFEVALKEQEEESPPDSPIAQDELNSQIPIQTQKQMTGGHSNTLVEDDDYDDDISPDINDPSHPSSSSTPMLLDYDDDISPDINNPSHPSPSSTPMLLSTSVNTKVAAAAAAAADTKNKEYDDDDEEENVDVELSKFPSSNDPAKSAKMQAILSQFTENQMNRYESFRRSALQKANMRRLLVGITGSQKISIPMTIVVCVIAKLFVGELVETARMVMTERKESGPIRPCHIREAYRRLKLEGKVPRRSVQRLFH